MTDYQQGSYDQINATLCQLGRLRRGEISLIQFEEWLRSVQRTNGPSETEKDITEVCDEIRDLLIKKNRSYGDSALKPVRIFSKADAEAGLKHLVHLGMDKIALTSAWIHFKNQTGLIYASGKPR